METWPSFSRLTGGNKLWLYCTAGLGLGPIQVWNPVQAHPMGQAHPMDHVAVHQGRPRTVLARGRGVQPSPCGVSPRGPALSTDSSAVSQEKKHACAVCHVAGPSTVLLLPTCPQDSDQGIFNSDPNFIAVPTDSINMVPTDIRGLTFSRTPQQVPTSLCGQ